MTTPSTSTQRPDLRVDLRGLIDVGGLHDAEQLGDHPAHGSQIDGVLAGAGLLAARAKTVEALRIRRPDRRTARRWNLDYPLTESAPPKAVLVAEAFRGVVHG
jgi:hypothetical protein